MQDRCETMGPVAVGLSGGVDSAVAAMLLKRAGYEVIGITMCHDDCFDTADARRVADHLDIPFFAIPIRETFDTEVKQYFVREYLRGRTPNPCVRCNRTMKWGALWNAAKDLGAGKIATGHYARLLKLSNGRYTVQRADTIHKDQTYALWELTQEQLAATVMPLAGYTKEAVRRIAAETELPVAYKSDSQDICFIPDGDYGRFIEKYCSEQTGEAWKVPGPGNFVLPDGTVIGTHRGITHYTVGQRKGLGIAWSEPLFVREIRSAENEVVLVTGDEVYTDTVICDNINWMSREPLKAGEALSVLARIRYNHKGADAVAVGRSDGMLELHFPEPVRAAAPGQSAVLYTDGLLAAGGVIVKTGPDIEAHNNG